MSLFRFLAVFSVLLGVLLFVLGMYAAGPTSTDFPLRPPVLVVTGLLFALFSGGFWEWAHRVQSNLDSMS